MVRDGYFYGLGAVVAALILAWLALPVLAVIPLLLGAFCVWFFRDPERAIPAGNGVIVSPADGKVTDVSAVLFEGNNCPKISIFLNVFNVHVNRSPIAGTVTDVTYRRGKFLNAMDAVSADENEQNIITVNGEGGTIVFKQIAGLIARRIICTAKVGDKLARGERVGLIKFGSRVDVIFPPAAQIKVKIGDHVAGGSSVLAVCSVQQGAQ